MWHADRQFGWPSFGKFQNVNETKERGGEWEGKGKVYRRGTAELVSCILRDKVDFFLFFFLLLHLSKLIHVDAASQAS